MVWNERSKLSVNVSCIALHRGRALAKLCCNSRDPTTGPCAQWKDERLLGTKLRGRRLAALSYLALDRQTTHNHRAKTARKSQDTYLHLLLSLQTPQPFPPSELTSLLNGWASDSNPNPNPNPKEAQGRLKRCAFWKELGDENSGTVASKN